jgi:hypothetical protein
VDIGCGKRVSIHNPINTPMTINFNPIWQTNVILSDQVEGSTIAIPLQAISSATLLAPTGTNQLDLPMAASAVSSLKFNGVSGPFTASGTTLFFTALANDTSIEIQANTPIVYDHIAGSFPKGLSLSTDGTLSGTPLGIKDPHGEWFEFTIRAENGLTVRDRTFRMLIYPVSQTAIWNMAGLPLESYDAGVATNPYRLLGDVKRGESFSFTIDVAHPDGDPVSIAIIATDGIVVNSSSYNGQLPPGLRLIGNTIDGVVLPNAPPGRYFFSLSVLATSAPAPISVMIEVLNLKTTSFKRPVKLQWVTPAGSIGTLKELDICNLNIVARNPNGGAINYNLLDGTGALPPGIILNPQTGDLEGQVLFVPANTTFSFTVRASSGGIFADQTFSISVVDRYQAETVSEISLKFQGRDKVNAIKGYPNLIPEDWVYRLSDINFGFVQEPAIHVAKGLYTDSVLSLLDYREKITCTFGTHHVSVVKDDAGNSLYEVLYRRIIDPMDLDPTGVENKVDGLVINYAQSKSGQLIHPMSIWNLRYDLLADYGTDNGDLLPEWMAKDSQNAGFKTAFAVAYLKPGYGQSALDLVNASNTVANLGYEVKFDRVLLSKVGVGRIHFDIDGLVMLPVYVPSSNTNIVTGKWTMLITEIITADVFTDTNGIKSVLPNTVTVVNQQQINLNSVNGTVSFPSSNNPRMFYIFVTGTPPTGSPISNASIGTDLLLGPFIDGLETLISNGSVIDSSLYTLDHTLWSLHKTTPFIAGSEIIVKLGETSFDNQIIENNETVFDYHSVPVGKYIKFSSEFKKYPV